MTEPKKNKMVDLNITLDGKKYFLEITTNYNFNLVYVEEAKKADGEEKKVIVGYYSDLFAFLERAQYQLIDVGGAESDIFGVAVTLVEIRQELTKLVIAEITKDKGIAEKILKLVTY